MEINFQAAIKYTIPNEGGFVNNPKDHGGATNWGITTAVLAEFRSCPVTVDDVKNLPYDEAVEIYRKKFWEFLELDQVNDVSICTAIFDISVNRGIFTGIQLAQNAIKVSTDGKIGPKTIAGLNSIPPTTFIVRFATIVQHAYVELALEKPELRLGFLPGWSSRAMRLLTLIDGVVL